MRGAAASECSFYHIMNMKAKKRIGPCRIRLVPCSVHLRRNDPAIRRYLLHHRFMQPHIHLLGVVHFSGGPLSSFANSFRAS